jgi:hypothetical protein
LIAVVTETPRFYYSAAKELKKRRLEFLSLGLDEPIPPTVKVVLTSEEEREKVNFERIVSGGDLQIAVDECIRILKGLGRWYQKLVIGIDPGLKPGVAVLGDGRVILVERPSSPEEILDAVKRIFKTYSGGEIMFRVGSGGGIYKMRIIKTLQENFSAPIEIVNEEKTTPINGLNDTSLRDIQAAINIATKKGYLLRKKIKVKPTAGEIKNLQRESRLLSGNVTISKELARQVARGEITLREAITAQRRKG